MRGTRPCDRKPAVGAAALVFSLAAGPAGAVDFFWSATEDVFGWFDRETPNGPPGFSPWMLFGGGISGQAPDDVSDRAIFGNLQKTTTLGTSVMIDSATMQGGDLLITGGTLTTINGFAVTTPDGMLSFTSGTLNNSAAQLVNAGTVRVISGSGTISSDIATSGTFQVGGGGTLNLNRAGATFTQTGGAFNVLSGSTANFTGNGHTLNFDGGALTNDGTLTVGSNSLIDLDGVTLDNRGAFNVNANGTIDLRAGSITNTPVNASFNVAGGGIFNYHGGSITGNAIQMNGGTLNLMVPLGASGVGSPAFQFNASGALSGDVHPNLTVSIGDASGSTTASTAGSWENRGNLVLTGATIGTTALGVQSGETLTNAGTVRAAFAAGGNQLRTINGGTGGTLANTAAGNVVVEAGVQLTANINLANVGDVTVGTGGSLIIGSGDRFDMNAGTLTNHGAVRIGSGSSTSVFRYAGGSITGNAIELNNGQLELDGGTGPATFHFIGGTLNELSPASTAPAPLGGAGGGGGGVGNVGDIGANQTVIVDATTGDTNVRRGTVFNGDFSLTNTGTLRLTGAAANGSPLFSLNGNSSTFTNNGLIHAEGVAGSTNQRTISGSSGAQIISSDRIVIDPDTTLTVNLPITNGGDVTIGPGGTLNSTGGNSDFTHNAGTLTNQGALLLGSGDDFTFSGGTITGNAIDITEANLTLAPGTGPAQFILRRGRLTGDVNPGQTVHLRNDTTGTVLTDTPAALTNHGTILFGGDGTGGHFFRIGELFQNLTLTNEGVFRTRNDDPLGNGGARQVNGVIDNHNLVVVEGNTTYNAVGTINRATFAVEPGGTLNGVSSRPFTQQAGTLVNNGTVFLGGGRFEYHGGTITGNPITLDSGTLTFGPGVTGAGTFIMVDGGALGGEVSPNATVDLVANATGTTSWSVPSGGDPLINRGVIHLDNSAGGRPQFIGAGVTTNETPGQITGIGALSFLSSNGTVVNRGTIAPGDANAVDPTGLIEVFGFFTQEATGVLELDLGGTGADESDRITANREITLAGTLALSLTNGYTPVLGDTVGIITRTSGTAIAGDFDAVLQPALMPAGLAFAVNVLPSLVELEVIAAAFINGDYNASGLVEQGDLDLVLGNWGDGFAGLPGGWVNQRPTSGIVDQAELDGVLQNWGNAAAPDFGGLSSISVPEPAAIGWFVAGLLAGRRRLGRRV